MSGSIDAIFSSSKTCAVVVTYNPDQAAIDLVDVLNRDIELIIVVDNASIDNNCVLAVLENNESTILISNKTNVGIAGALNQGFEVARQEGYDLVISFDQDSILDKDMISIMLSAYNEIVKNGDKIGMLGANYSGMNKVFSKGIGTHIERDVLITSGALMSCDTYLEVGGYETNLFIDSVDFDMCLKLLSKGYKNYLTTQVLMSHQPGSEIVTNVLGLKVTSSNHSALRRYYMTRNHIYLIRKYFFRFPYFILKKSYFWIMSIIKMIMIESQKLKKCRSTLKGLWHGIIFSRIINHEKYV